MWFDVLTMGAAATGDGIISLRKQVEQFEKLFHLRTATNIKYLNYQSAIALS
jgi:hypothetical protein